MGVGAIVAPTVRTTVLPVRWTAPSSAGFGLGHVEVLVAQPKCLFGPVLCPRLAEQLRGAARKLLSAFKVLTVWLLMDSDDAIPRGSTGKVDARRLRDMLAEVTLPKARR
jgi:acyl-CoA synthetase (AMP-forming)/AMP-acid ligase II